MKVYTGYHYTSFKNWQRIEQYGLQRQLIKKDSLLEYFDAYPMGIWTWEYELRGLSEAGAVIYQIANKGSSKVIKLAYKYVDDDILHYDDGLSIRKVRLAHMGSLNNFIYHDEETSVIVMRDIKPADITLVRVFDLLDLVK